MRLLLYLDSNYQNYPQYTDQRRSELNQCNQLNNLFKKLIYVWKFFCLLNLLMQLPYYDQESQQQFDKMKAIFLFLFILHWQPSLALKTRRNINQLSPPQYNQYHILYRLLFIVEPNQKQKNLSYQINVTNSEEITIAPQNLYDSLIAIHVTTCKHIDSFFSYWHRAIMMLFEKYLQRSHNYALQLNQSLTYLNSQTLRLQRVAMQNNLSPDLNQIKEKLQAVVRDYSEQTDKLPKDKDAKEYIAAHYWNLMDYKQTINYPKGFYRNRKTNHQNQSQYFDFEYNNKIKNADALIKLIYDQEGFYELNFITRWYREKISTASAKYTGSLYNLFNFPPTIQETQILIQDQDFWKGIENQLKEKDQLKDYKKNTENWITNQIIPIGVKDCQSQFLYEYLYKKWMTRHNEFFKTLKLQLDWMDAYDLNFIFGGKGSNFIVEQKLNKQFGQRNRLLPYVMYAKSLKTKPYDFVYKFTGGPKIANLQHSMEHPHNYMHAYQLKMLSDSKYSILNPIFFAFHSFIDAMLEIKIKLINQNKDPSGEQNSFEEAITGINDFMDEDYKASSIDEFKDIRGSMQKHPQYKDVPIIFHQKYGPQKKFETIKANTIQKSLPLKYYDAILLKINGTQKLRQVQQFAESQYDFNILNRSDPFISSLYQIINQVPSAYTNQKVGKGFLSFITIIKQNQTQSKTELLLKDKQEVLIEKKVFHKTQKKQYATFTLLSKFHECISKLNKQKVAYDKILNVQKVSALFHPNQIFLLQISDQSLKVYYRIGRIHVKISLSGATQQKKAVLQLKIKNETSFEGHIQEHIVSSNQKKVYGKQGNLIESVKVILIWKRKRTIQYEFCLFAQYSQLSLNLKQPAGRVDLKKIQNNVGKSIYLQKNMKKD